MKCKENVNIIQFNNDSTSRPLDQRALSLDGFHHQLLCLKHVQGESPATC